MEDFSEFENAEKMCHRYVVQYSYFKNASLIFIKVELNFTLRKSFPSFTTIQYLTEEFKGSCTICQEEHRGDRPNEVTTPEIVKKIHKM